MQTPEQIKRRRELFANKGRGKFARDQNYEDTECRTDLLKTRGYTQDEDGTWVP